jgi:hypothetical protein
VPGERVIIAGKRIGFAERAHRDILRRPDIDALKSAKPAEKFLRVEDAFETDVVIANPAGENLNRKRFGRGCAGAGKIGPDKLPRLGKEKFQAVSG